MVKTDNEKGKGSLHPMGYQWSTYETLIRQQNIRQTVGSTLEERKTYSLTKNPRESRLNEVIED